MSTTIYRETSLALAYEMVQNCKLPPSDVHATCANFYLKPESTSDVADKGLILVFSWNGNEDKIADTHLKLNSDTLYHVSSSPCYDKNGNKIYNPELYWVSRIFNSQSQFLKLTGIMQTPDFPSQLTDEQKVQLDNLEASAKRNVKIAVA
ncbi:hypothetical protein CDB79_RS09530 [Vibrio parahaemolyticus]|uniref:hypothetical protein n=1 Tax=Vibrio parahaemolyticus TaxID=670 RepID=UPI000DFE8E23|nr:hypothetical protein [Vibrio parahaemolyticus]EJG1710836.1 hypothetical protein [Vibrio parahaemolyticus]EJG1742212.1 hypothetical protein [Vibrio parahaemolyticus]EJG1778957.1 hypothetical protein [Vibrio parahaemolyticus]SUP25929.1 Uncharacterised protein [Vibrio parahaemolyticus]HCG5251792.1 hypothetical protein [Vibrio parahaemolyticus]